MTRFIYLHGFASSPQSGKAQFYRKQFQGLGLELEIPALDAGDFRNLTITGQLAVVGAAAGGKPCVLIGSSLGGYLAALYAARHSSVKRLVLLAPALRFPSRWRERYSPEDLALWKQNGFASVYHYGQKRDAQLGYQLMEDSIQYEDEPDFRQPALILHGTADAVVPAAISTAFASSRANVTVRLFASGHELTDVLEDLWEETFRFLEPAIQEALASAALLPSMIKCQQG